MNESMKTQMPIYRAKSIMSKSDTYIIGCYIENEIDCPCIVDIDAEQYEINKSTLAIHFPDMIDSEGTKIFASLSEDGKGGDIIELHHEPIQILKEVDGKVKEVIENRVSEPAIVWMEQGQMVYGWKDIFTSPLRFETDRLIRKKRVNSVKVTGIQQ